MMTKSYRVAIIQQLIYVLWQVVDPAMLVFSNNTGSMYTTDEPGASSAGISTTCQCSCSILPLTTHMITQ